MHLRHKMMPCIVVPITDVIIILNNVITTLNLCCKNIYSIPNVKLLTKDEFI